MILIDHSAGSRDLVLYPPLDNPSLATLTSLSSSSSDTKSSVDVQFTGHGPNGPLTIVIEFKSLPDLLASIFSGRIQDTQIPAMRDQGDICWLLYYGDYRRGESGNLETPNPPIFKKKEDGMFYWAQKGSYNGPFNTRSEATDHYLSFFKWSEYSWIGNKPLPWSYLESSLLSYSAAGIQHKHFSTITDCANWIYTLYKWWQKPFHSHKSFRVFDRTSDNRRPAIMGSVDPVTRSIMDFADRIDGVDFTLAKSIASHFSSVQEMVNADIAEWMKIDGIGKIKARIAVETMRREKGEKGEKSINTGIGNIGNLDLFK